MKEQIEKQAIEEMAECLIDIQRNFNEYCAKPCRECELGGIVNCENHYKAEALYNAGYRRQSEWISVEERLPQKHESVLVYCDGAITEDFISSVGSWYDHYDRHVTHWMPLPEPPSAAKMKGGAK